MHYGKSNVPASDSVYNIHASFDKHPSRRGS